MEFVFKTTNDYKHLILTSYPNDHALQELRSFFKRERDSFFFDPAYRSGAWDGWDRFFVGYKLPFGLWHELLKFFHDRPQYTVKIDGIKEFMRDITKEHYDKFLSTIFKGTDVKELRYYQYESAYNLLKYKYAAADLSTAAGKTVIFFIIAMYLKVTKEIDVNHKMLIVVPKKGLSSQTYKRFTQNYNNGSVPIKIAYFGGKSKFNQKKFDEAEIVISTYQSLLRRKKEDFKKVYHIGVDEAHGIKGDSIKNILNSCGTLHTRFGLSGTLIENRTKSSFLTVQKFFGPFVYEYETHQLIKDGYAPEVTVKRIILEYPKNDELVNDYMKFKAKGNELKGDARIKFAGELFDFERQTIIKHPLRMEFIKKLASALPNNKLFLFNNVKDKYGYKLYQNLKESNTNVFYIDGNVDENDRDDYINIMDNLELVTIIELNDIKIKVNQYTNVKLTNGKIKYAKDIIVGDDILDSWINSYK